MKNFLLLFVLLLGSCLGPRAEDNALFPAMISAWPGLRADIEASGNSDAIALDRFGDALKDGDRVYLWTVNWVPMEVQARRGIVSYGYSEGVTRSLLERVIQFRNAFLKIQGN